MQLNQILQAAVTGDESVVDTAEVTTEVTTDTTETTETVNTDPSTETATTTTTTTTTTDEDTKQKDPAPKSNPMKEVRDRLNQEQKAKERIDKAINRFAVGDYNFKIKDFKTEDGKVDYDAFIKAMDDADLETRSKDRGITPEIQAEVERIEREKQELLKERMKVAMDRALVSLQQEMKLDVNAVNKFFKDSMALQKNPYTWISQGGSLQELYFLVYKDSIIKAQIDEAVEAAKATWNAPATNVKPVSNPAKSTTSLGSDNGVSLSQLLSQASKK